jgi:hypothetical protein
MNRFIKYPINGDTWVVYIVPDDDEVIEEDDAAAFIEFDKREIYFRTSEVTESNIRHELWHVHKGYCYLHSAVIDQHNMEEIGAELFADRGPYICEQAKDLCEKLIKLKKVKVVDNEE